MLWEDGERFRVAKIGDPDRTLTWGTHVFEIRYSIAGVLDPGTTGANKTFAASTGQPSASPSVFFWNVIARIVEQQDRAGRHLRHAARRRPGRVQCSVGFGMGRECRDVTVDGDTGRRCRRSTLPPRTPVTVRAGVDVPTPPQISTAVAVHLGPHPGPVGDRRGVDRRPHSGVRARRVPVVPHHRRAVARISAAVRAAAGPRAGADRVHPHRELSRRTGSTATLFYLAERKLIDLRQVNDKQWNIRGTGRARRLGRRRSGQRRGRYRRSR